MKLSDGLFLDCCRNVANEYSQIEYDEIIIDNACMQLVLDPSRFDTLLLENLYGDIVSDLAAGLVGGLGVAPGANYGREVAVFEAVRALKGGTLKSPARFLGLREEAVGFVREGHPLLTGDILRHASGLREQIVQGTITVPEGSFTSFVQR